MLTLLDRNVALLAALCEERLVTRASFFQLAHIRKARAAGVPRHLIAHEDLLVFRNPPVLLGAGGNPQQHMPAEILDSSKGGACRWPAARSELGISVGNEDLR